MAAAQSIPGEVLEVAELDGATGWKKTVYVISPLLKNTILVALVICISGTMKVFDQIFVMTKGGPGTASEVLTLYMYNNTFSNMRYGFGSAISMIIVMISFVIIVMPQVIMMMTKLIMTIIMEIADVYKRQGEYDGIKAEKGMENHYFVFVSRSIDLYDDYHYAYSSVSLL